MTVDFSSGVSTGSGLGTLHTYSGDTVFPETFTLIHLLQHYPSKRTQQTHPSRVTVVSQEHLPSSSRSGRPPRPSTSSPTPSRTNPGVRFLSSAEAFLQPFRFLYLNGDLGGLLGRDGCGTEVETREVPVSFYLKITKFGASRTTKQRRRCPPTVSTTKLLPDVPNPDPHPSGSEDERGVGVTRRVGCRWVYLDRRAPGRRRTTVWLGLRTTWGPPSSFQCPRLSRPEDPRGQTRTRVERDGWRSGVLF